MSVPDSSIEMWDKVKITKDFCIEMYFQHTYTLRNAGSISSSPSNHTVPLFFFLAYWTIHYMVIYYNLYDFCVFVEEEKYIC